MIIRKPIGKSVGTALVLLSACVSAHCYARGVSPYLPLNLSPDIERKIERVLILADKPIMRRPIAAAVVLDALPKACQRDEVLCGEVRQYLDLFMHTARVTEVRVEGAVTSGQSTRPVPNQHGMPLDSHWDVIASAYYQPSDYLLINGGVVGYQGRWAPTGSVVSVGTEYLQLDAGFRDHWFSPNTDSSMLMSTEAPTMPSITISNYQPITSLGINYEVFLARMSTQRGIRYKDTTTDGHPNLAGIQLGVEPADGYAINVNRLMQYGGGARGSTSLHQFYKALFSNNSVNRGDSSSTLEFGNQQAAITANAIFPARVPFAFKFEYAAEDSTYAGVKYFGDTALTIGLDLPQLGRSFDFNYELSEWQNAWYVHGIYPQGMRNSGFVTGHWFGDQRATADAIGGHSQVFKVGYTLPSRDRLQLSYRDMAFVPAWAGVAGNPANYNYHRYREAALRYAANIHGHFVSGEVSAGRDVSGKSFARLSAAFDFVSTSDHGSYSRPASDSGSSTSLFVDVGVNRSRLTELYYSSPSQRSQSLFAYHVGIGARRQVSENGDLGVRIEADQVNRHGLLSLRALDYRFRLNDKIALNTWFGIGRYETQLPSYGWYTGIGVQYRDLFSRWDLNIDLHQYHKLNRDAVLPGDLPANTSQPRVYFDVEGAKMYLSRRW